MYIRVTHTGAHERGYLQAVRPRHGEYGYTYYITYCNTYTCMYHAIHTFTKGVYMYTYTCGYVYTHNSMYCTCVCTYIEYIVLYRQHTYNITYIYSSVYEVL